MTYFSAKNRQNYLNKLASTKFDVIIIGGGITGAGILLDAQLRGLSCCLLEMQDFSEGTSSRSTRLIHGGLRYLKQWNFKLVKETGQERNVVAHIARHLTHPKKVLLPVVEDGTFSKIQLKLALWMYERLAGVPKSMRHSSYSPKGFMEELPALRTNDLRGGIEYVEFQSNDSRLTLEVMKKGVEQGGIALSRMKVVDWVKDAGQKVIGVKVIDLWTNEELVIEGASIINATGPWTDNLAGSGANVGDKRVIPTKGIHLVFDEERFPISKAVYFDTPDKRMIFAIPASGRVYVGTTDTFFKGDISNPEITKEDVNYLVNACNSMFPEILLQSTDVISAWSGVRPLIYQKNKKPSEISRKYEIYEDDSGVLTIAGGKLTGYRKMAEKCVDQLINSYFKRRKLNYCSTVAYKLSGSDFTNADDYAKSKEEFLVRAVTFGWNEEDAQWVFSHFGSQAEAVLASEPTSSSLPDYLIKSLYFTLSNEMVMTSLDFLNRRTNLLHFHPEKAYKYYKDIAEVIYNYVGASPERQIIEEQRFIEVSSTIEKIQKGL